MSGNMFHGNIFKYSVQLAPLKETLVNRLLAIEPSHLPLKKLLRRVRPLSLPPIIYRVNAGGRRNREAGFIFCEMFWCPMDSSNDKY